MKQKGLCTFHLSLFSAKVRWRGQRLQLELLALTIQTTSNPVHIFLRKKNRFQHVYNLYDMPRASFSCRHHPSFLCLLGLGLQQ